MGLEEDRKKRDKLKEQMTRLESAQKEIRSNQKNFWDAKRWWSRYYKQDKKKYVEALNNRDDTLKTVNLLEGKVSELSEKINGYDKDIEVKDLEKELLEEKISKFTAH